MDSLSCSSSPAGDQQGNPDCCAIVLRKESAILFSPPRLVRVSRFYLCCPTPSFIPSPSSSLSPLLLSWEFYLIWQASQSYIPLWTWELYLIWQASQGYIPLWTWELYLIWQASQSYIPLRTCKFYLIWQASQSYIPLWTWEFYLIWQASQSYIPLWTWEFYLIWQASQSYILVWTWTLWRCLCFFFNCRELILPSIKYFSQVTYEGIYA